MAKGDKLTPKQERFCLNLFQGMSQRVAYIDAGYSAKRSMAAIDVDACRLAEKPKIVLRLAELQQAAQDKSVATVLERKQILTKVIRADLAKPDSTIASEIEVIVGDEGQTHVTKVKYPNRITAISELNKMEKVYSDSGEGNTNNQYNIIILNSVDDKDGCQQRINRVLSGDR